MAVRWWSWSGIPALLNDQAGLNALHYYLKRPTETGGIPAGLSMLFDWHGSTLVNTYTASMS